MKKKILTLDDLVRFCESRGLLSFNAEDSGYQLCVQIPAQFSLSQEEVDSMLYGDVTLMHTGRNRNGSNVTEDAAKKCLSTIPYKPLLAEIREIDGELDFTEHAREIKDGKVMYIEKQIGCFTADKSYLDDEADENGRKYIHCRVAIPREYTSAAEIIERKGGTKVSAELAINSMSYDSKDHTLLLTDVEVMGATCLGKNPDTGEDIQEGMEGAKLEIEDFSIKSSEVCYSTDEKMVEMLQMISDQITQLTINNFQKGGKSQMNKEKFEELLVQYGKTEADITFEYSDLDDDSLAKAFADAFDSEETAPSENESESEEFVEKRDDDVEPEQVEASDEDVTSGDNSEVEDVTNEDNSEVEGGANDDSSSTEDDESDDFSLRYSVEVNGKKHDFAVSLQDKIMALSTLVNDTYAESDNAYYCCDVYEEPNKYVVMHDFWDDRHFKQEYTVKKDVYALKGDRVQVYAQYLTHDEISQLETMKRNYSSIESELSQFKAEPEKIAVLESADYDQIKDTKQYAELAKRENYFELSKDDLTAKLDSILLDYAKKHKVEFASKEQKPEKKQNFFAFARIENNTSFLDGLLNR